MAKDHYLVSKLDSGSLSNIFGKAFASSEYYKFVKKQVQQKGDAYWVVFPELMRGGDLFVIFTLWQKSDSQWKITHMDIICQ